MPKFWMISNRQQKNNTFGSDRGPIAYWTADQAGLDNFHAWTKVTASSFQTALVAASDQFPLLQPGENENQNHVCFFVHGFNNGWEDAARRYEKLCDDLFSSQNSLGLCISFDWPSYGNVLGYFPDRNHARECASDLTDVLSNLYDWLLKKQKQATVNPANACRAKVSMIAHSMGNFLLQKAMSNAWTRKNQPLLSRETLNKFPILRS